MLLETLLVALQPTAAVPAPDPRLDCAPRMNMTAAGPPPPAFSARRMGQGSELYLSVHRCGGGAYRVERWMSRGGRRVGDLDWVPVSQCPALARWVAAATRLSLPAPLLRPRRSPAAATGATWFALDTHHTAGAGTISSMALQVLEPAGAAPNALSAWVRDGEQSFKTCHDQGLGGSGYAPLRRPHG